MDFVVDQMVQFQHVHDTDGDLLLEGIAALAIIEGHLARIGEPGADHLLLHLLLGHPFKDWRGHGHTQG